MNMVTSATPDRVERRDPAGSFSPPIPADSGCWHHVQWPLGPGASLRGPRFRGGVLAAGSVRKLAAWRLRAELSACKLRPGTVR